MINMSYEVGNENYIMVNLNEKEFVELMEAHHRWKWGNHMPFIVEKRVTTERMDTLYSVKPRYVYRDGNSEFYVDEDLVKIILSECFEEFDIQNIYFNTSYIKHSWTDYTKNIKRDEKGYPVGQDAMRMMRHPEMYQGGTVSPTFENIVIYAKAKNNDMDNEYKLSL